MCIRDRNQADSIMGSLGLARSDECRAVQAVLRLEDCNGKDTLDENLSLIHIYRCGYMELQPRCEAGTVFPVQRGLRPAGLPRLPTRTGAEPVSYTHLDVYKRQQPPPSGSSLKGQRVQNITSRNRVSICNSDEAQSLSLIHI